MVQSHDARLLVSHRKEWTHSVHLTEAMHEDDVQATDGNVPITRALLSQLCAQLESEIVSCRWVYLLRWRQIALYTSVRHLPLPCGAAPIMHLKVRWIYLTLARVRILQSRPGLC